MVDTTPTKKKKPNCCQAKVWELIYNGHIDADRIFKHIREAKHGCYKAFVKWHNGLNPNEEHKGPHTHVALILRDKPKIRNSIKYFTIPPHKPKVGEVGPTLEPVVPKLQAPIGRASNKSVLGKMTMYVEYLVDGHDNGTIKDSWGFKYDYELLSCTTTVGKVLLYFSRGLTWGDIWAQSTWDERGALAKSKKSALSAWREH